MYEILLLEYTSKIDMQDNVNLQAQNGWALLSPPTIIFDNVNNPTYLATLYKSI